MKEDILKKLSSKDKNEVREAILALEGEEDPEVLDAVVEAVVASKSKAVLEAGKNFLLSYSGDPKVLCDKVIKFFDYPEPKLRQAAIDILSSKGDACLDVVLERLVESEDYNMRKFALDILANVKTKKALSILERLIEDENPNVSMSALEYLRNFSEFTDDVVRIISKAVPKVKDTYGLTTLASTVIYGEIKDGRLVAPLKSKLEELTDPMDKYWIYKVLIFLGEESIYEDALKNAELIGMRGDVEKDIKIFGTGT